MQALFLTALWIAGAEPAVIAQPDQPPVVVSAPCAPALRIYRISKGRCAELDATLQRHSHASPTYDYRRQFDYPWQDPRRAFGSCAACRVRPALEAIPTPPPLPAIPGLP